MKRSVMVFVMCSAAMVWGCERNPVEKAGTALVGTIEHSRNVADQATLEGMNRSVQAFRAEHGRNPEGLDELERYSGRTLDRAKFAYDASTGTITLR